MNSALFVMEVKKLQLENGLNHAQVTSALIGIVISICRIEGEDPLEYMKWALQAIEKGERGDDVVVSEEDSDA
jgi:hypothetical protein